MCSWIVKFDDKTIEVSSDYSKCFSSKTQMTLMITAEQVVNQIYQIYE